MKQEKYESQSAQEGGEQTRGQGRDDWVEPSREANQNNNNEESKSVSFALDNAKAGQEEPQADSCTSKSNLSKRQRKRAKQKANKFG